jgi:hypothetical protein
MIAWLENIVFCCLTIFIFAERREYDCLVGKVLRGCLSELITELRSFNVNNLMNEFGNALLPFFCCESNKSLGQIEAGGEV